MKLLDQMDDAEYRAQAQKLMKILAEVRDYFEEARTDGPDYGRIHRFLEELSPFIEDPDALPDLLTVSAELYSEEGRYQKAAQLVHRAKDPEGDFVLQEADFYNSFYVGGNSWWARQKRIWDIFQGQEKKLRKTSISNVEPLRDLMNAWEACFPTREIMVIGPSGGKKGVICLGLPDGIFSLVPMLYLQRSMPANVAKNWDVVLEVPDQEQGQGECLLGDRAVPANQIRVDIVSSTSMSAGASAGDAGKVVLVVWHPYLQELVQNEKANEAMQSAICCVNAFLPQSVRLLYVDCIALAGCEPPKKMSFPLPELVGQMEARNMAVDIPLDQVLQRRRRTFTRKPISCNRPRADIVRGETSMPELEEIYFQRKEEHLISMQRYGTSGWFLVIPRSVCGDQFPEFRRVMEDSFREFDTACIVGWAEGLKNYYVDLIFWAGGSVLDFLGQCFAGIPECKSIRCSTFYWNSPLRTLDCAAELEKFGRANLSGPVEERVDRKVRSALEKLASATKWEKMDIPAPNLPDDTDVGFIIKEDDIADRNPEEDEDVGPDVSQSEDPYAQFSELFVRDPDDDEFTTMLKNMACMFAGRELEDPEEDDDDSDPWKWIPANDIEDIEVEIETVPEEDDSDLSDLHDEASIWNAFQKRMEDPQFAALMGEVAKRAAAGPPDKQKPVEEDDDIDVIDDDDVVLIPPWEYEAFQKSNSSAGTSSAPKHVHNTKRKGLSRKKDKSKRKKKKK